MSGHALVTAIAVLAASAVLAPSAGANSDGIVRAPSGVMYVTGAVGSDEVDRLKSMEGDFNLKLVFSNTSGAYLSDVKVTIVDASGRVLLDATSEGPIVMAKLPSGGYRVDASFDGHPQSRKITAVAGKLVTVDLRWGPGTR
ncbi:MAG: carboxypeptidase regulatory-like domain-containing protein [Betaproteobacteria bacterium]|nr:carboxypeptidase regulatory-like domain-containing protein [Betaproteobacteria bacterium]